MDNLSELTAAQLRELYNHASEPTSWIIRWRPAENRNVAARLYHLGLLDRHQQSEHYRGDDKRVYWYEYTVTEAGRALLRSPNG